MKSIFNAARTSSTTVTNTPRLEFVVGRKYKDHTVVYKIVDGKKIRLKCVTNTNPLHLKKVEAKAAKKSRKSTVIAINPNQPSAA